MFKKLIDSLFEDVEEIIEIEEEVDDPVELPPIKMKQKNAVLPETSKSVYLKESQDDTGLHKEVLKRESRSTMISVDELKEPAKGKKIAMQDRKSEYEFTQRISPIFGLLEDQEDQYDVFISTLSKRRKVTKTTSILGTVLSPIYGTSRDNTAVDMDYELVDDNDTPLTLDDLIQPEVAAMVKESSERSLLEQDVAYFDSLVHSFEEDPQDLLQEGAKKRVVDHTNLSLFDDFDDEQ